MEKIKKYTDIILIIAIITLTGVIYFQNRNLGSALTYSGALNKMEVFNYLKGVSQDIGVGATSTWNPGAVASTTIATTSITVSGAALGDFVDVSFDSGTSTDAWTINGKVSAANTVMVMMESAYDTDLASLNLTTSTVRVRVASSTVNTSVSSGL